MKHRKPIPVYIIATSYFKELQVFHKVWVFYFLTWHGTAIIKNFQWKMTQVREAQ